MKKIEVCLTPELIQLHDLTNKIVVVVDILRATSCMISGISTGLRSILPVADVNVCKTLALEKGYLSAAERDGHQMEGFDLGNSPFQYMEEKHTGKSVVMTTTNGTLAISRSLAASQIMIAGFLNISATSAYLSQKPNDVIIHCAGWKGTVNIEDTLFAGALIDQLIKYDYLIDTDATFMAHQLYLQHATNIMSAVEQSSHFKRLSKIITGPDVSFCLTHDQFHFPIGLVGEEIIRL